MSTKQHLPTTPSELIRLALADLRAIEDDDGYVVDMCNWHWPTMDNRGRKVCLVCLAGAVIAQTLDVPREQAISIDDLDSNRVGERLRALDFFRLGEIEIGLAFLRQGISDLDTELGEEWQQYAYEVVYDPADPGKFHAQMHRRADFFESCGI